MLGPLMEKFDEVTSWDGMAECNMDLINSLSYACDYYLVGGNRAMALKVLEDALAREEELLWADHGDAIKDLKLRYEKYFGENGLFLPIDPKDGTAE